MPRGWPGTGQSPLPQCRSLLPARTPARHTKPKPGSMQPNLLSSSDCFSYVDVPAWNRPILVAFPPLRKPYNQLRARRHSIEDAAVEGAVLRLRPNMMTMLVATLGVLPAALSHAIGSDSQRPFRDRYRVRSHRSPCDEHLLAANPIRMDRWRGRCASPSRRDVRRGRACR